MSFKTPDTHINHQPTLTNVLVSISDVEAVREGHQSEVLLSIAEEYPADLCFTLVFHGRQGNLDLVAESPEEAQAWIQGVRKLIHKTQTMDEKERLDQYPLTWQLWSVCEKLTTRSLTKCITHDLVIVLAVYS